MPRRNYIGYRFFWLCLVLLCTGASRLYSQTANFTASITKGCSPLTINFSDLSTGGTPVGWNWDFGNNSTSTAPNPSAIYSNPGSYTVSCRVTFSNGAQITVTKTNYIQVFLGPTANFVLSSTSGCANLTVNFSDRAVIGSAPIRTWLWDFGNGVTNQNSNPSFTYSIAGNYSISLQVEDTNGCLNTATKSNHLTVLPKPTADFGSSTNNSCSYPHTVTFVNTTMLNASGAGSYYWDFGNGNFTTNPSPSQPYNLPGNYSVSLVATNSLGCRDTARKVNFVSVLDLDAAFTANRTSGCPPLSVSFTNTSTPTNAQNRFEWDFGNGQKSTQQDTSMVFIAPGTYTVSLKMTAPNGCTDSVVRTSYITVLPKPNSRFLVNDSAACRPPLNAQFTAVTAGATSYSWRFGDGTTSTLKDPQKTYSDTGLYSVSLTIRGANGCVDSFFAPRLMKIRKPIVDFRPSVEEGCKPLTVNFSNTTQSVAPITQVLYRFGDGNTSTQGFPTHIYQDTGIFIPKIYITTDDGCTDSAVFDTIGVGLKPKADFTATDTVGCRSDLVVKLTNLTNNGPVKADSYFWYTGIGAGTSEVNPEIRFSAESGKYLIQLIAAQRGCKDTMTKRDIVTVLNPTARYVQYAAGCNSDSVFFSNSSIGGTRFSWKFGDGDSSDLISVSHKFMPGNWPVYLAVYDSSTKCYDTARTVVSVASNDNLKFRGDTTGCTRSGIWFFDQTPGSSGWIWDFGNGRVFTSRNVMVEFDKPGYYTVRYSAIVQGCRITTIKTNYLHVYGPNFTKLTPDGPICAPNEVNLITKIDGESSLVSKNFILLRNGSVLQSLTSFGDTIPYLFPSPNTPQDSAYIAYYAARDSGGCFNYTYDSHYVYRPYSDFSITQLAVCQGNQYRFEQTLLDTNSKKPFRYTWDFGDSNGITLDSQSTEYTYFQSANRRVRLITTDSMGCPDTVDKALNVDIRDIRARISANQTYKSCPPFFVNFRDSSVNTYNGIEKWEWRFGDNSTGQVAHPSKLYVEPGQYDVFLKVTDTLGCSDSVLMPGYINLGGTKISYSFDTTLGCEPLEIKINSQSSNGSNANIKWDMRDGSNIVDSSSFTFRYRNSGAYIPIAFIQDSTGCQYSLPVHDTIQVLVSPQPDFTATTACLGSFTRFTNTSSAGADINFTWEPETGKTDTSRSGLSYLFPSEGIYAVKLTASNPLGCQTTISKPVLVSRVLASLSIDQDRSCVNDSTRLRIHNTGPGKTDIIRWQTGSASFDNFDSSIQFVYSRKGIYYPTAIVTNEYGCSDTTEIKDSIIVGDNFAPQANLIYRASVISNDTVNLVFSAWKSADFEKYIVYRENTFGRWDSIAHLLSIEDTSYFDPNRFNLSNTYRYKVQSKNFCGYYSDTASPPAHRTINLRASTADDASYLTWNAYEGFTPNTYEIYREKNGNWEFLKRVDGYLTEAWDSAIVCNTGYFYKVLAKGLHSEFYSWSDSSGAIPNYIPYVPPSKLLSASILDENKTEIRWAASSGGKVPVISYHLERSSDGLNFRPALKPFDKADRMAIDLVDSTYHRNFYYRIIAKDSCGYFSSPSNLGKTVLLKVKMDSTTDRPLLEWTSYLDWSEGVSEYRIEIFDQNGWNLLAVVDGGINTYLDEISPWNERDSYIYRITAYSPADAGKMSRSNPATARVTPKIFVPNAFRPDGHPENRVFKAKGIYILDYHILILNRWGEVVYEGFDMNEGWDGNFKGEAAQDGIYFYKIEYRGVGTDRLRIGGNLHLLR